MNSTSRSIRTLLVGAGVAGSVILGGCQGHGQYTSEGKEKAQTRVAQMKSATSWDMANQQYMAGDLDKALKNVDQSISLNPKVPKSHLLRGRILIEMGRLETALESLDMALQLDPTMDAAKYYRGIIFERFSRPEDALKEYMAAADLDTTNPQYVLAASEMLIDLGRLDEAEALMSKAKDGFQNNAGVRQTLGHIAMMRQQYDRAVTLFAEASLLGPEDLALVEDLARAQMAAKQFGQADSNLRRVLAADTKGERRDLRHMRARCLIELNQPVEARSILMAMVAKGEGTNDVRAWAELGNIALILNDDYRVREAANRLIALRPNSPDGYVLKAVADRRTGNLDRAVATLAKAIPLSGRDSTAAKLQGLIYQEMGKSTLAAQSFALAVKVDPKDAEAARLLATVHQAGNNGLAKVTDE